MHKDSKKCWIQDGVGEMLKIHIRVERQNEK